MRDVALMADVGTVTVYRHFADEKELLAACSGTFFKRHPLPDPAPWQAEPDPRTRLRQALRDAYAYHRKTRDMMASVISEVRGTPVAEPYDAHWREAAAVVATAWDEAGKNDSALLAAIELAMRFETWQFLTAAKGLSDDEAAALMMRLACPEEDTA